LLVDVVERAGQVFEDEGLSTLLISAVMPSRPTSGPRIDARAIGVLKDLRVEAMLVVGSVPDRKTFVELLGDTPVVVAAAGADGLRADVVRNDDHLGMRLVVDYLVAAEHTAVAHLAGPGGVVAEERVAGYCAAMTQHGLESEIVVAEADFTEDAGYRGCYAPAPWWTAGGRDRSGQRPGRSRGDVGGRRRRPPGAERRCGHRVRRHLRRRDPSGVTDLGQPRQLWHRNPGGALRAPSDRRSRAGCGRASSASAAGDALQLGCASRWLRSWGAGPGGGQHVDTRFATLKYDLGIVQFYWTCPGRQHLRAEYAHAFDLHEQPNSPSGNALLELVWATAASKYCDAVFSDQPHPPSSFLDCR
jgi:hypothetical protein